MTSEVGATIALQHKELLDHSHIWNILSICLLFSFKLIYMYYYY